MCEFCAVRLTKILVFFFFFSNGLDDRLESRPLLQLQLRLLRENDRLVRLLARLLLLARLFLLHHPLLLLLLLLPVMELVSKLLLLRVTVMVVVVRGMVLVALRCRGADDALFGWGMVDLFLFFWLFGSSFDRVCI